jgi:hypothetical protein
MSDLRRPTDCAAVNSTPSLKSIPKLRSQDERNRAGTIAAAEMKVHNRLPTYRALNERTFAIDV